jgi:preprotein translocase subunit SecD
MRSRPFATRAVVLSMTPRAFVWSMQPIWARARQVLRPVAQSTTAQGGAEVLTFTEGADGLIEARMTPAHLRELSRQAAQQSIEVIRRRIDPDGTAEVAIARQGDDRIAVQAPGVTDPQQLRDRIGQTALMTFHMVREVSPEEAAAGRLPPGTMVVQPYPGGRGTGPEVVERRPRFTGERLVRANASTDGQTGEFVLSFALDSQGSTLFCRITREYHRPAFRHSARQPGADGAEHQRTDLRWFGPDFGRLHG